MASTTCAIPVIRCALLLFLSLPAIYGASAANVPVLSGRVNDEAGVLRPESIVRLEGLLKAHEDSTSNQVVVLTVASLNGEAIEAFSIQVVDAWKLGRKGKDNGVLLLIAPNDRKVRIEVGRGLEGDLPDITCGSIIRKEIIPRFKEGDYDGGTVAGVTAILAAIRGSYTVDADAAPDGDLWPRLFAFSIFLAVVGVFTGIAVMTPGRAGWFLYLFLLPFWGAFPSVLLGPVPGGILFGIYAVGLLVLRLTLPHTKTGRRWQGRFSSSPAFWTSSGGGWASSGSSSSGSSFSGGGGGFSGGGASGGW